MDAELYELCKQTMIIYSYVGYDDNNDFTWQTDVTTQDVTLTDMVGTIVHTNLVVGTVVLQSTDVVPIVYQLAIDYTIDYTLGTIARTLASTIPSGVPIHISYSWQTVTSVFCRAEYSNKLMRNKDGQEIVSTCQIYCEYFVMKEQDKIVLVGTTRPDPEIVAIQHNPDEFGNIDHMVIYTR